MGQVEIVKKFPPTAITSLLQKETIIHTISLLNHILPQPPLLLCMVSHQPGVPQESSHLHHRSSSMDFMEQEVSRI